MIRTDAAPFEQALQAVASRRRLARAVGARALVMLKNDKNVLPLAGSVQRLAVLGPLADAAAEMGGPWRAAADPNDHISVLAGLEGLSGKQVLHAPGVDIEGDDLTEVPAALELCAQVDVILLCLGEGAAMSGEAASRAHLGLPGRQRMFAEAVLERAAALGKPVIAVLFSGRPLIVPWLVEKADALLAAWFLGSEAGNAIADVITGRGGSKRAHAGDMAARGRADPRVLWATPERAAARTRTITSPASISTSPTSRCFPFGFGLTFGHFTLSNLRVTDEHRDGERRGRDPRRCDQ